MKIDPQVHKDAVSRSLEIMVNDIRKAGGKTEDTMIVLEKVIAGCIVLCARQNFLDVEETLELLGAVGSSAKTRIRGLMEPSPQNIPPHNI